MIALVLGMGQDGTYLSEHLLSKGYTVIGGVRRSSQSREYLNELISKGLKVVECDVTDYLSIYSLVQEYKPDHIYNLAAQSHVSTSFKQPLYTWDVTAKGVLNILEIVRTISPNTRIYQASSSEMFGCMYSVVDNRDNHSVTDIDCRNTHPLKWKEQYSSPKYNEDYTLCQIEETPFKPQSPYSIAKLAAHESVRLYRESYNLFACSGILFNHESERRGEHFVTRKITKYIGKLVKWKNKNNSIWSSKYCTWTFPVNGSATEEITFTGNNDTAESFRLRQESYQRYLDYPKLKLGNLDACRDWSHAEDLVKAMVIMLEADKPDDYVIGSGETHTVREFVKLAFEEVGLNWEDWVELDPSLIRPAEVDYLCSKPTKAKEKLGWEPSHTFKDLVSRMVKHDIELAIKNDT